MINILKPGSSTVGKLKALPLADRLETHVRVLAENIGERNIYRPGALSAAADYIEQQWRAMGYEVTRHTYELEGVRSSNLEITQSGTHHANDILLIGAHYDSATGSPGANDNGSGVAAILEMARHFADLEIDRTVRFVAFVNEEPPIFFGRQMGSMIYAKAARKRGDTSLADRPHRSLSNRASASSGVLVCQ